MNVSLTDEARKQSIVSMSRSRWLAAVPLVGLIYLVSGLVFGTLAGSAANNQMKTAWRLAAWLISAAAFAAHIGYENIRLRSSPRMTAFHVCLAVGLGGFGLAVAASLHSRGTQHHFPASALAIWPIATAVPAFLVAWAVAALLTRIDLRDNTRQL